jgi:Domain of unknown function (DUF4349)
MGARRRAVVTVAAALVTAVAVGCTAGGSDGRAAGGAGGGDGGVAERGESAVFRAADTAGGGRALVQTAARLPRVGPSIIKTADVEVGVPRADLQEAIRRAVAIAGSYGGFVSSTGVDKQGAASGTVVIRVPSTRFEDALTDLEDLGNVRHENVSGVDVTQEFVDLQARLRNWQAQETVLLRLMNRAESVTDTIRVQGELSRVQLEIERLRGRLDYLEDQTDLGTISATFVAAGPAPQGPTTLERAWRDALQGSLEVVSTVIVGAGYLVPVAILAAVVVMVFRGVRPRVSS